ncbi:carboxymuconolactone decarboxylase family protein [Nocardia cyriacigeorgica]|uniref:carboxymuconolactone decarboxylase family protein n=1 Tax=Nocardia cyriacigeorgica TaxID=135487 RepID=UPI000CEA5F89|nr:hypothetical protein [Nocardia cyriacigeorgica]AVH23494.1 hypothetical protein C5B73_20745 [Nocardia cyriacigeorgica]MBF6323071.1 hypothetical protein [Nocardia cyriacigeorgica]PPJ15524.1 hypothetical protein C5E43_04910 [Nocardia cyriacigeorgica]
MTEQTALGWSRPGTARLRNPLPWRYSPPNAEIVVPMLHHLTILGPWTMLVNNIHLLAIAHPILPIADWELIALRGSWNCGGRFEWENHVLTAKVLGKDADYLVAIKDGPSAPLWNDRQAAILTAVDELHEDQLITEATQQRLLGHLSPRQYRELYSVGAMYEVLAMVNNFCPPGELFDFEPRAARRSPARPRRPRKDRPLAPAPAEITTAAPPTRPHIWVPHDPEITAEFALNHPWTAAIVRRIDGIAARRMKLAAAERELAVQRMLWRVGPIGEWTMRSAAYPETAALVAAGPDGPDASRAQSALMRAVDELDTEYFISDDTWARLRGHFSVKQLLELVPLVGIYRVYAAIMNNRG